MLAPGLMTALGAFASEYVRSTTGTHVSWPIFSAAALAIVVGLSTQSIVASVAGRPGVLLADVAIFSVLCDRDRDRGQRQLHPALQPCRLA